MDDDLMFQYLLQMGAMQPEQQDLRRKQAMIDALRSNAMQAPQGQMVGKHYVPPSLTQYAAQLGQGYMAGQAQNQQNQAAQRSTDQQQMLLDRLRRQRMGMGQPGQSMPYDPSVDYGASGQF